MKYRSKYEKRIAEQIKGKGKEVIYEQYEVLYVQPQTVHKYTPDFVLSNGIVIETKGYFSQKDRQKHLLLRDQHPELDIRIVFQNPNVPIRKGSDTTYGAWATKKRD